MAPTTESVLLARIHELETRVKSLEEAITYDRSMGTKYGVGTFGPNTAEEHAMQLRNYRLLVIGATGRKPSELRPEDREQLRDWFSKGKEIVGSDAHVGDTLFWV